MTTPSFRIIPRDEYEALKQDAERGRKALWLALNHQSPVDLLVEIGFYTEKDADSHGITYTVHEWTPLAHAFAREIKASKEGE